MSYLYADFKLWMPSSNHFGRGKNPNLILLSRTTVSWASDIVQVDTSGEMHHIKLVSGVLRLGDYRQTTPSNVLLFRLWGKLESQFSGEMSDTNVPVQMLKVKIKAAVSKLPLQTKQPLHPPRDPVLILSTLPGSSAIK